MSTKEEYVYFMCKLSLFVIENNITDEELLVVLPVIHYNYLSDPDYILEYFNTLKENVLKERNIV